MSAESLDDDERLVAVVKNYPNLYDTTLVSYRDNVLRENTWVEIGKLLGAPADSCSRSWRLLRDRYVREKKRLQSAEGDASCLITNTSGESKRVFAQMGFVGHYIKHRNRKRSKLSLAAPSLHDNENDQDMEDAEATQTFRNFESLDQQPEMQSLSTATEFVLVPATSIPTQSGQGHHSVPEAPPSRSTSNGSSLYRVEANPIACTSIKKVDRDDVADVDNGPQEKHISGNVVPTVREDAVRTLCELGEEEHFALSVAATLRRLPPRTKALAKLNIQKILYDIEFQGTDH